MYSLLRSKRRGVLAGEKIGIGKSLEMDEVKTKGSTHALYASFVKICVISLRLAVALALWRKSSRITARMNTQPRLILVTFSDRFHVRMHEHRHAIQSRSLFDIRRSSLGSLRFERDLD